MPNSFKMRFKQLAVSQKAVLLGSGLIIISAFLPWYSDLDRFKTGDTFLGITGPLYLAGLIALIAGVASFGYIMLSLLEKSKPKLPLSENHFHVAVGALSALMLVLSASVYFHTKFGVNLTEKTVGIGIMLGLIGSTFTIIGGIMSFRKQPVSFDDLDGHLEPLINVTQEKSDVGVVEPVAEPVVNDAVNREVSVGDAIEAAQEEKVPASASAYVKESTQSWGPVQESLQRQQTERSERRNNNDMR